MRVQWRLWHDLTPNPKDFEVQAAFETYLESGCDALLAIGGGSCIDLAKAVAILSGNGGAHPRLRGHRPRHQSDPADGDGPDDRRFGL